MINSVLEEIKNFAVKRLTETYGYCGLADGDEIAMINSDDREGNDIIINIKVKKEDS